MAIHLLIKADREEPEQIRYMNVEWEEEDEYI